MADRKPETLRAMTRDDVRSMIIRRQGWDPGDLDPAKIQPLKPSRFTDMLKVIAARPRRLADEPRLGSKP